MVAAGRAAFIRGEFPIEGWCMQGFDSMKISTTHAEVEKDSDLVYFQDALEYTSAGRKADI